MAIDAILGDEERYTATNEGSTQAAEAVLLAARQDAQAFVDEFGQPIDPSATDWDAEAFAMVAADLRLDGDDRNELWPIYQAELVAETARLAGEAS